MSIYKLFGTDADLEKNGFALEYGDVTLIIARAGGANEKFQRNIEKKMRPYRSAINSGTMHEGTSRKLLAKAYAEAIILAWENVTYPETPEEGGEHIPYDEEKAGQPMPFTVDNVAALLLQLPELFDEIVRESQRIGNFVKAEAEADAKS